MDEDQTYVVYERNGIEHYVMTNYAQVSAVWLFENYEFVISGNVTEDEMKMIINSIYER